MWHFGMVQIGQACRQSIGRGVVFQYPPLSLSGACSNSVISMPKTGASRSKAIDRDVDDAAPRLRHVLSSSIHGTIKLIGGTGFRSTCGQVEPDKAHCCTVQNAHCNGQLCIAAAEVAAPVGPAEGTIHVDMLVHGCHVPAAWPSWMSAAGSVFCRRLRRLGQVFPRSTERVVKDEMASFNASPFSRVRHLKQLGDIHSQGLD